MDEQIKRLLDQVEWNELPADGSWADGLPRVTHSGVLDLMGIIKLRVHQLSDGRRIVDSRDLLDFLQAAGRGR